MTAVATPGDAAGNPGDAEAGPDSSPTVDATDRP
jgi:hypothetical protein